MRTDNDQSKYYIICRTDQSTTSKRPGMPRGKPLILLCLQYQGLICFCFRI